MDLKYVIQQILQKWDGERKDVLQAVKQIMEREEEDEEDEVDEVDEVVEEEVVVVRLFHEEEVRYQCLDHSYEVAEQTYVVMENCKDQIKPEIMKNVILEVQQIGVSVIKPIVLGEI